MLRSDALENTKTNEAISMLNETWPIIETAYNLLIGDGMSSKKARTLCTSMMNMAFAEEKIRRTISNGNE